MGSAASRFAAELVAAGISPARVARAMARIRFEPESVATDVLQVWARRLAGADGALNAQRLFDEAPEEGVALDWALAHPN
jgi:hypothetical protein